MRRRVRWRSRVGCAVYPFDEPPVHALPPRSSAGDAQPARSRPALEFPLLAPDAGKVELPTRSTPRPAASQRVVILSFGDAAELVAASAVTRRLREARPDVEITLWCPASTAAVGALLPGVDIREVAPPFWTRFRRGGRAPSFAFARHALGMRARRFDIAIVTSASRNAAVLATITGARIRIGAAARGTRRWFTDSVDFPPGGHPTPVALSRLLMPLGITPDPDARYSLDTGPLEAARERVRYRIGRRPVALHPFAATGAQCLPLKFWIRSAIELQQRGYEPLWIGSAQELAVVHRAIGSAAWRYADRLGDGTFGDTVAALSLSHLFIGHDAAPLHIAAAFGVPAVAVHADGVPADGGTHGDGRAESVVAEGPDALTEREILAAVDRLPNAPPLRLVR